MLNKLEHTNEVLLSLIYTHHEMIERNKQALVNHSKSTRA